MSAWIGRARRRWRREESSPALASVSEPAPRPPAPPQPMPWDVAAEQERLFALFATAQAGGAKFLPLGAIDHLVAARRGAILLKHDVHDVDLGGLIRFAEREARHQIRGSYFFLPPGHPRARHAYPFEAQLEAMQALAALGHELGLHIDPYFQIHEHGAPLAALLDAILARFAAAGLNLRIGNTHGNSRHKHPDRHGFGTAFELFAELARQPDFPVLADLPAASAAIVRANRVRLADHGFVHWGDMPLWSARHGIVATNFLTDNGYGSSRTLELLVRPATTGAYYLAERAVPGSRNLAAGERVALADAGAAAPPLHGRFALDDPRLHAPLRSALPLLFLVHPEFYC